MAEPNDGSSTFIGVHLAVADMAKAMHFYRRAGLPVPDGAEGREHVQMMWEKMFTWHSVRLG
jgi:hypothetical protein